MNDEERRGWVVKWMHGAGELWLTQAHMPSPGSDLAADDMDKPTVSDVASYGIASAIDHLGSVVDAMVSQKPIRHYAHFTTLRTALLASARVQWTLGPDESVKRQLRSIQIRYQNVDEQRKSVNRQSLRATDHHRGLIPRRWRCDGVLLRPRTRQPG